MTQAHGNVAYISFLFRALDEDIQAVSSEVDYCVSHPLIIDTDIVAVDESPATIVVRAALKTDVNEDTLADIAASLEYAFPRIDAEGEYNTELIEAEFTAKV